MYYVPVPVYVLTCWLNHSDSLEQQQRQPEKSDVRKQWPTMWPNDPHDLSWLVCVVVWIVGRWRTSTAPLSMSPETMKMWGAVAAANW